MNGSISICRSWLRYLFRELFPDSLSKNVPLSSHYHITRFQYPWSNVSDVKIHLFVVLFTFLLEGGPYLSQSSPYFQCPTHCLNHRSSINIGRRRFSGWTAICCKNLSHKHCGQAVSACIPLKKESSLSPKISKPIPPFGQFWKSPFTHCFHSDPRATENQSVHLTAPQITEVSLLAPCPHLASSTVPQSLYRPRCSQSTSSAIVSRLEMKEINPSPQDCSEWSKVGP